MIYNNLKDFETQVPHLIINLLIAMTFEYYYYLLSKQRTLIYINLNASFVGNIIIFISFFIVS